MDLPAPAGPNARTPTRDIVVDDVNVRVSLSHRGSCSAQKPSRDHGTSRDRNRSPFESLPPLNVFEKPQNIVS